ncbi:MAG: prolipoprotein diacylglyceryl transferase [Planctomycetota bacterium]|jgi:phosphatidylglycerol:prolipoprotein diacylglycerol transferase
MHPELWKIPGVGWSIKSYGFMLMCGFLISIYLAMRRAMRVKADPDLVLNMGFVSLICGIVGARVFFVAHYWKTTFASADNPFLEAINITAGGLEYYGGLFAAILGCVIYVRFFARYRAVGDEAAGPARRRPSLRLYLDVIAPAAMLGLAFGRAGCFLNGCCWGGLCLEEEQGRQVQALPWALQFPFGSPAHQRQWENRQVTVPAELVFDHPTNPNAPFLVSPASLAAPVEEVEWPMNHVRDARERFNRAKARDPESDETGELEQEVKAAQDKLEEASNHHFTVYAAMGYPARPDAERTTTRSELAELAAKCSSLPVHPAQLYGLVNAVLLSLLLEALFYRRKRHGLVFGAMLVLYPVTRVILELVRVDNPHDVGGLTISQAVSVGAFLFGVAFLYVVYSKMPLRSVRAVAYAPPASPENKR